MNKQQRQLKIIGYGLFFLVLMVCATPAFSVDINVSVDRDPVVQNESFQLRFSAPETPDDDPDFSPLYTILDVINQSQSTQSSWVNGQSSRRITWTLTVMPKVTGQLTIPTIKFGDDQTSPLTINVVKETAAATKATNNDALFIEVETTPEEVYVQSQILYTVRLYQHVQLSQASLTEPSLANALVEKLGDDKQFNTQINGVNYRVFERKYAIFPQQSGELTIPPITLTAEVITGASRSPFGGFFDRQQTQTKRISSKAVSVNVLPIPKAFTASHWLAAEDVQVQQTWSNDELTVPVGEPLTRTLALMGQGVSSSQLPELVTEVSSAKLKMYPDQPVLRDQKNTDGIIAIREQKVAIIPSKPGRYELPAINIPWFNTKTHQMETATVPAVTIKATAVAPTNTSTPEVLDVVSPIKTTPSSVDKPLTVQQTNYWKWTSLFLATGWLATVIGFVFKGRHIKQVTAPTLKKPSTKASVKTLRNACLNNNPKEAMSALLNWAEQQYNTRQLHVLNQYIDGTLQTEINRLNEVLYANNSQVWDGSKLIQLIEHHTQPASPSDSSTEALEPLHKL